MLAYRKFNKNLNDLNFLFLVVTSTDYTDPGRKQEEDVLGYAYANFYRRSPAFGGTVEILIYLDPIEKGLGIGKK